MWILYVNIEIVTINSMRGLTKGFVAGPVKVKSQFIRAELLSLN